MAKEFLTINDHRPELFVMLRPTVPRYFFLLCFYVCNAKYSIKNLLWKLEFGKYICNIRCAESKFINASVLTLREQITRAVQYKRTIGFRVATVPLLSCAHKTQSSY